MNRPFFSKRERAAVLRVVRIAFAVLLACAAAMSFLALASYYPDDPGYYVSTSAKARNWLGGSGAFLADVLRKTFGIAAFYVPILIGVWAARTFFRRWPRNVFYRLFAALPALLTISAFASSHAVTSISGGGLGGIVGDYLFSVLGKGAPIDSDRARLIVGAALSLMLAISFSLWSIGARHRDLFRVLGKARRHFLIACGVLFDLGERAAASPRPGRARRWLARTFGGLSLPGGFAWAGAASAEGSAYEAREVWQRSEPRDYGPILRESDRAPTRVSEPLSVPRAPRDNGAVEPEFGSYPDVARASAAAPRSASRASFSALDDEERPARRGPIEIPADPDALDARREPDFAPRHESSALRNSEEEALRDANDWLMDGFDEGQDADEDADDDADARAVAGARAPDAWSFEDEEDDAADDAFETEPPLVLETLAPSEPKERRVAPPLAERPQRVVTDEEPAIAPAVVAAPLPAAPSPVAPAPATRAPSKPSPSAPARQDNAPSKPAASDEEPLPAVSLLSAEAGGDSLSISEQALAEQADRLQAVLAEYGVRGEIIDVHPGPVVSQFELEPAPGLKSARVVGLADDIARSMSAVSARIARIPGRNTIGIELPNEQREIVTLRGLIEDPSYRDGDLALPLALGRDIAGAPVAADLAAMPHLLIGGATGSGKSVAINTMLLSLLYSRTPEETRLILIDPKMLELSVYNTVPHLLAPVVTEPKKAVAALRWVVREMEERYQKMARLNVRSLESYNQKVREAKSDGRPISRRVQTGFDDQTGEPIFETQTVPAETMPYIVVVIDEMADLMMVAGKEIEHCVQRLAQMARASGIHLIMATQRPSVDVITGVIKANFPIRISFQVTSKFDSRTILGEAGAEQLLGKGDMLFTAGGGRLQRLHGPFVSDEEVSSVVAALSRQPSPGGHVDFEAPEQSLLDASARPGGEEAGGDEALYAQAVEIVARERRASTSFVQRRLQIGYNRAARLIEMMEEAGVVSPANRVGKREVLVAEPS